MAKFTRLLSPREVQEALNASPSAVRLWANTGKLTTIRTPGGHRRFLESEVRVLLGLPGESEEAEGPGGA